MKPIVLDGPIGTALQRHGMPQGVCPEQWALQHPKALHAIQTEYVQAGAQHITAPTFGANSITLADYQLAHDMAAINQQLVALTRANIGTSIPIGGNLSPLGQFVPPYGDTAFEDLITVYTQQANALARAGVDYFHIETQMNLYEAHAAVLAVQSVSNKPIWVSFTCDGNGKTLSGADIEVPLVVMQAMGVSVFGLNCVTDDPLPLFTRLQRYAAIPLLYKPNAGLPDAHGCYHVTPTQLSTPLAELAALGVVYFGTCCGGTAEHLTAMHQALQHIECADPQPTRAQGVTADTRHVYPPNAPDGETITITDQTALETLAEEQFFITGPLRITTTPQYHPALQRTYHGLARL